MFASISRFNCCLLNRKFFFINIENYSTRNREKLYNTNIPISKIKSKLKKKERERALKSLNSLVREAIKLLVVDNGALCKSMLYARYKLNSVLPAADFRVWEEGEFQQNLFETIKNNDKSKKSKKKKKIRKIVNKRKEKSNRAEKKIHKNTGRKSEREYKIKEKRKRATNAKPLNNLF